jgi:nicotinamidase-related amidase
MMLTPDKTLLVLIDVQEKLTAVMHKRDELVTNLSKLIKGMRALEIPIIQVEQNPSKMGPTIPELQFLLADHPPLTKACFSCCGSDAFNAAVKESGRKQILIAGIETHVCVYQTAVALIRDSYAVEVVVNAVSSRNPQDHAVGLEKIREAGRHSIGSGQGHVTTVETALFELMRTSEHSAFRDILKIVK